MSIRGRTSITLFTATMGVVAAVALPGGAGAQAARDVTAGPAITEYALPAGSPAPQAIASAPAALWYAQAGTAALGIRNASGSYTQDTGLSAPATGLVAAGHNDVWFTEASGNGAIGHVAADGTLTQFTAGLTPHSAPTGIAVGPGGNLWFTEAGGNGAIGRITPAGAITEYTTGLTPGSQPQSIASGPDGNLWFTEAGGNGAIGRITPAGAITEYPTPTAGSRPEAIAFDGERTLWVTETGAGRLASVTFPSTPAGTSATSTTTTGTTTSGPTVTSTPAGLPQTVTAAATQIGSHEATVTGTVVPGADHTTYHFDFGTTTAYGQQAPTADAAVGADSGRVLTKTLTGLAPDTVYHYRIVATDCGGCQDGTSYGADMTFETLVDGSQSGDGGVEAPSVAGKTAVAGLVAGTVLVRSPHSGRLVPLTRNSTIPIGSLVDASHGTVSVTTALGHTKRVQSVTVWGGSFTLHQRAGHGMTTLALAGSLACPAPSHATMHAMLARRTPRTRRRAPRRRSLWAHDNHGQYSTRGNNSVATVRGTWWETVDTCAGTLTYVKRGLVSVRDLRHHRTVLVRAGHRYLARR